jgi:oligopeptide/dipeptide ABC transporter ATP-binding protein
MNSTTATRALPQSAAALLKIDNLVVDYRVGFRKRVRAVAGVSLEIKRGSVLALIGESGSGKSTIARAICGLGPLSGGSIWFEGRDLAAAGDRADAAGTAGIQIVFQDSTSALDPRWPVWRSVIEPRLKRKAASLEMQKQHAISVMARVGLHADLAERRPTQLSGGQRQRVTIARALAAEPTLIVLDEAVSALDVSVRNEVLTLLDRLRREDGLTYLFVSHDMGAVVQIASEVAVLYLGKVVECGEARRVIAAPAHPYTKALIAAVPSFAPPAVAAETRGEIGDPANAPSGCRFHPRCAFAIQECAATEPLLAPFKGRLAACLRLRDV